MNTDKLLGKMKEKRLNYTQVAAGVGISERTLCNRLKKGKFYTEEAEKMKKVLDLSMDEFMEIFFKNLVTSDVTK